jgi:glucose/arabinose dehydrogenase
MKLLSVTLLICAVAVHSQAFSEQSIEERLELIKLPPGFSISVYAQGVENSRQLVIGDKGTVFAGSTKAGKVHAVVDSDGDYRADRLLLIDDELKLPSGVEFKDGALFVAALDRLLRYDDIETQLEQPPQPTVLHDKWPDKTHHGWKYLRFGPDSKLYVPIGAPCNICDEPNFAEIRRFNV